MLNRIPHHGIINIEILVYDNVSETDHVRPRHLRMVGAEFCGYTIRSFAENGEIVRNGRAIPIICHKLFVGDPIRKLKNLRYGIPHVLQALTVADLSLHTASRSRTTSLANQGERRKLVTETTSTGRPSSCARSRFKADWFM